MRINTSLRSLNVIWVHPLAFLKQNASTTYHVLYSFCSIAPHLVVFLDLLFFDKQPHEILKFPLRGTFFLLHLVFTLLGVILMICISFHSNIASDHVNQLLELLSFLLLPLLNGLRVLL